MRRNCKFESHFVRKKNRIKCYTYHWIFICECLPNATHTHPDLNNHYDRRQVRWIQFMDHIFIQNQFHRLSLFFSIVELPILELQELTLKITCSCFFAHKYLFFRCVRYTLKLGPLLATAASTTAITITKRIIYADFNYIFTWHAIYYAIKTRISRNRIANIISRKVALATMMLMAIGFVIRSFECCALKIHLLSPSEWMSVCVWQQASKKFVTNVAWDSQRVKKMRQNRNPTSWR